MDVNPDGGNIVAFGSPVPGGSTGAPVAEPEADYPAGTSGVTSPAKTVRPDSQLP